MVQQHPSSIWPQNPHLPPAFVSFPLRCFLDTICNPAAVSCWIISLFLVLWSCIQIGLCYRRGMLFTVPTKPSGWARLPWWITAPWLSQPFETWDACSGVQQLVSTWRSFGELSSAACRSPEICSEVHATVLAVFVSTVR